MNVATYQSGSAGLYNEIVELRAKVAELEGILEQCCHNLRYESDPMMPLKASRWYDNHQEQNKSKTPAPVTDGSPKAS